MLYKVVLLFFVLADDLHDLDIEIYVGNAGSAAYGIKGHGSKGNLAVFTGEGAAAEIYGVYLDARVVVFLALKETAVGVVLVLLEVRLVGRVVGNRALAVGDAENAVNSLSVDGAEVNALGHVYFEL